MVACKSNAPNPELLKLLLENGVDVNAVNNDGQNALHSAIFSLCPSIENIELLLKHKVDVNLKDQQGNKKMFLFLPFFHLDYKQKKGLTPLRYIVESPVLNVEIVKLLLENKFSFPLFTRLFSQILIFFF